jgi:sigma-E factor negative regulatory protein RseA
MTDLSKEQLSACLDGELPPAELDLLLKRMAQDDALGRTASRYSLIGAALREQQAPLASVNFAAEVAHALEQEAPREPTRIARRRVRIDTDRWLRPALSAAMAAGIAVFAVLIVNRPDPAAPVPVVAQAPVAPQTTVPVATPVSPSWSTERLANYVVAHSEYSSPLGRPMVLNGLLVEQEVAEPVAIDEPVPSEP